MGVCAGVTRVARMMKVRGNDAQSCWNAAATLGDFSNSERTFWTELTCRFMQCVAAKITMYRKMHGDVGAN